MHLKNVNVPENIDVDLLDTLAKEVVNDKYIKKRYT